jgi:hypothetical protein
VTRYSLQFHIALRDEADDRHRLTCDPALYRHLTPAQAETLIRTLAETFLAQLPRLEVAPVDTAAPMRDTTDHQM